MATLIVHTQDYNEFTWVTEAVLKFLQIKGICHEAFRANIIASKVNRILGSDFGITEDSTFTYISNALQPSWMFSHIEKDKIYGKYILDKLNENDRMNYFEWDKFRHKIYLAHQQKLDQKVPYLIDA